MSTRTTGKDIGRAAAVHPSRLFVGSCFGVGATAMRAVVISAIMGALKEHFVLSNEQVGFIGGASMWGFTITMLTCGSLCDVLGMKLLLRLAFMAHVVGTLLMVFADGFTVLFAGALTISMADGLVQAACNPLVATLYADRKTEMFAKLHLWFPGGMVIGGLVLFGMDQLGVGFWQAKLVLIIVPAVSYGLLFVKQVFPATERVQSGLSFGQMCRETFLRPLFWVLVVCMMMTASVELGPNAWVPAVLEAAGIPGILVLVWISLLMALMRVFAGPMVRRFAPTGILLASAVISGVGLLWLSYTETLMMAVAAGTVFALGVSYFWPTMIGVTSERVPKGGALALAMMGAAGMVAVGLVTTPMMGRIADGYLHDGLRVEPTVAALQDVAKTYPALAAESKGEPRKELEDAAKSATAALAGRSADGSLPAAKTAKALRLAVAAAPKSPAAEKAKQELGPAENYGGRMSFRWVALLSVVLTCVFAVLYARDLARGGYQAEKI